MDTSKHGPATGGAAPAVAAGPQDDGVSRWTVTRLGLIEALREGWPDLPLAIVARSADTVLAGLPSVAGVSLGEQPHDPVGCDQDGRPHLGPCTEPDPGPVASALFDLARALDAEASAADDRGLTRHGTIRSRAFRRAAAMAWDRARAVQGEPNGAAPVSPDTGSRQDGLRPAPGSTP
jgi:hypothetical protein